jgi:hypothetical protein
MNLPKIYAHIAPDGRLLEARVEPPVSSVTMGGQVYEYVPVGEVTVNRALPEQEALEKGIREPVAFVVNKVGTLLKVPVVWVRHSGAGNPLYAKGEGVPVFVIGEEGENVLRISKPTRVFVPIFESSSLEERAPRGMLLERMLALAECCLLETGMVGTIIGFFQNSYKVMGEKPMYVTEVGLLCTASSFDPSDEKLSLEDCERFGLPVLVEIDTERVQPG